MRLRSPRLLTALPALLAGSVLVTGCAEGVAGDAREGTRVVASFYPLAYVAERVAGEHAEIVNLTSPGTEPHDLEMSVSQTAEISEADIVAYEKGFQAAVDEAVAEHGPDRVVEVTDVVELTPLDGDAHADEHADEHADDHDAGDLDLHFWLDPALLGEVAAAVEEQLAEVDPDNAEDFAANLSALQADLDELDADYESGLAQCRLDTVVVSHDAFGYLERYGLHFEPIAGLTPDAEPSPAHLAELAGLMETEEITTVFSETLASPEMAQTLARELDADTAVLDPIEGLSDETADEDYVSLMRENLQVLQTANDCR